MEHPEIIFLVAILVCLVLTLLFVFADVSRMKRVAMYRLSLLDKIDQCASADLLDGRDYKWRYDMFNSVSFEEMCNKPWKSLDSFYPDKSFLE